MKKTQLKEKLISMFDYEKLKACPEEWGFFNELERDVKCVGYAVNITPEVISQAQNAQVDFLLTHHDSWQFLFGLKEKCNEMLKESHMTHAFFHAPLDDADFGTTASLASALGIQISKKVMPYAKVYDCGIIGELEPVEFDHFAQKMSYILQEKIRCYQNNGKVIRKVAVAAGGGNMTNDMKIAVEHGCDTYITGEYALYTQQYAKFTGMNLFVGSHTNTELLGVETMAKLLCKDTGIKLVKINEPND